MKITGAKIYTGFIVCVIVGLLWALVDSKFVSHLPESQVIALLPETEMPVWEASDSAMLAESQARVASQLTAQSALIMDIHSRTVVFEKNADTPLPPASTTKLLTALTALRLYDLDEVTEVSTKAAEHDGGGLFPGEQINVESLLVGTIVSSANDAAQALAEHAPGGETQFLHEMNMDAQALHLRDSTFQNSIGYDDPPNLMSARDLAIVTLRAIQEPELYFWMGLQNATVESVDGRIRHILFTTNELLGVEPRLMAGKTGTTEGAGQVLVSVMNQEGHLVLIIVMGSQDRYADTRHLLRWVEENIAWGIPNGPSEL